MGINVSTSMGFENKQFLRNTAKEILQKNGVEAEKASQIAQKAISANNEFISNTELNILKASTQVTLNSSLKETLKYLNAHANDKRKKYVLGELWEQLSGSIIEGQEYKGELLDFVIDDNTQNIFAA